MSPRRVALVSVGVLLASVLTACEDPAAPLARINQPVSLTILSGGDQTALEYTELPQPIVVQILNAKGKPVPGQFVNFRVLQGGGSVYAGTAFTDNQGIAREWWTIGSATVRNLLEARAVDPSTGAQLVLATVLAHPQPLVDPRVQFKCGNQVNWEPSPLPEPGGCYGPGENVVPRVDKNSVIQMQVRVVHGPSEAPVPVPGMWLDFYADHNSETGTPPTVSPVYGVTNSLGIATLVFTIGSVPVLNELTVIGPLDYLSRVPVVLRVQPFFVRP